jgi:hypothetical protein
MGLQDIVICAVIVAGIAYVTYQYTKKSNKLYLIPTDGTSEGYSNYSGSPTKFYVYNYYKVPITVQVSTTEVIDNDKGTLIDNINQEVDVSILERKPKDVTRDLTYLTLVENVPSGKFKAITEGKWKNITDNKKIIILDSNTKLPIGKSTTTIPKGKTIKALHCGMNSGHSAIEMSSDITKSPLGTALPRLRIVNVTPRTVNLTTTGGNILTIPASKSLLYFGEYENGIPMGVTFRDIDGILPDYNLKIPITDLFLGVISDIEIPLYRNSKIGQAFFDDPGVMYHPFEELRGYQLHRGAFIDKSYIPKNW